MEIIVSIVVVLVIIYVVPFLVYGALAAVLGLKTPETMSPARFLVSVLISKTGTAITFVALFYLAREEFIDQWLPYALAWWVMFVFGEIAETLKPEYSWKEAAVGILSEAIYLPLAALAASRILG